MRLLKYNDDGELGLTNDLVRSKIPKYAILSHTWGPDTEEVTYRDLIDGTGKKKVGYRKIQFCGEQARRDNLHNFWVDTCCIDKSNNAEVAEAINSMFQWYRDAAKCYVFLSDVPRADVDNIEHSQQLPWESAFRTSRWFARGWTLQELIAPKTVKFYSRDHVLLGDKTSLQQQICGITGIATEALQGHSLEDFSIKERLRWVDKRDTTKDEDLAYCLLGIFNVSLPLIYGEGRMKAMRRLEQVIMESGPQSFVEISQIRNLINLSDVSENIWKAEHSKIMQSLSTTNFWGKQVDLFNRAQKGSGKWILEDESFKSWLTGHPKICWCKGEAGAGKTFLSAIIINYLSVSMKNKNIGIAWLYVDYRERDSHTLENFYANLLHQLFKQIGGLSKSMMKSLGSKREEAKPTAAEYKSWLQEEVEKFERTIIIIDALDEMRTEELCKQLIDELRSLTPRIHLLVTSRSEVQLPIMSDDLIEIDIRPRKDDVILFIESRLQDSPLLWDHIFKTPSLRDRTINMLSKASNRMFLKAELILNVLEHLKTAKEVEEALNSLPDTYDGCYEFTLKQIERQDASQRQLAFKALSWLSFVFDGLTVSALQEALSVQTGDKKKDEEKLIPMDDLINVCHGLVVTYSDIENNTQKICLLHETASTYLKSVGSLLGHEMILEVCLAYLSLTKFSELCVSRTRIDERGRQHPFYQYAATYWSRHVIEGELETTFRDPIIKFLESYQHHSADEFRSLGLPSAWGCDKSTPWTDWNKLSGDRRDHPLHAAAAHGLGEVVRYLIKTRGYEKDGRNSFGETALHRAAQVGRTGTMEELIAQGADLNSRVYHHYFKETTALMLAMNCQQIEAVRVLLNHGADLNTFDPKNPTFPLHIAASMNTSLTRLLLDHGATVQFPGISPQFPELWPGSLHFTVFNAREFPGALERVNLLLDRGANINAQSSAGNTALHMAILGGHQDLVHILLQKGANITLKNQRSKSAVQLARERGHLDWIEEGIPNELFRSLPIGPPLHRAIWSRNHSLVHELLEKGHDIAEEDQEMVTPWGYCILSGDVELAQILVEHMEKHKSISFVGSTAFDLALTHMTAFNYTDEWSWEMTVQICRKLLPFRKIFDPNLEFTKTESPICNYKKTFLIWAAERGRVDEAEFFLDCGSDVNAKDVFGASALRYAVGPRNYKMVKLLIRRGANPKLEDNTGLTPLKIAEDAGITIIQKLFQDMLSR